MGGGTWTCRQCETRNPNSLWTCSCGNVWAPRPDPTRRSASRKRDQKKSASIRELIAQIPVAAPDEAIANITVWEPPPPEADELKIYKSKAQSKLQKFANLLVAVRDAGKEDPALEFDIGVL
eukprot:3021874-Pyramimonas_sp.AAC.1